MRSDMKCLLLSIVASPVLHAKYLNTFSYLEYIGFRKIVKSQNRENLSFETLTHAVEEGRHALRLKKLALKIGGSAFDLYTDDNLLRRHEAENYFHVLDRCCEEALSDFSAQEKSRLTYLYVTWLVEVRALEVYGAYQELPGSIDLLGLLAEEELHLKAVETELRARDPDMDRRSVELKRLEESLYRTYVEALARETGAQMEVAGVVVSG